MLLGMLVSLYTSRVILQALGVANFGILNVVGGLVGMLSIVSSSLSSSISRFLTYELGTGNAKKLKQVFGTSLLIQLVISALIIFVAETIGLWFLNNKMVIPEDRMIAANWIYQASIFSFVLGLISCPYNASISSHEKMDVFAYFGITDICLRLGIVLFIAYVPLHCDKLIVYSLLLMSVGIVMQIGYWIYCFRHFPESRTFPILNKKCWKEMAGFAGWNTIGCTAAILKDQGVNILLNLFFGPIVNAARGIAGQVSGAVSSFSGNFMAALNPQIIKSHASNDRQYSFSLVERGSRFGFYIMMLFSIPIIIETDLILDLWLKTYPEYTVMFVRLTLILALIDVLSNTLITLQVATGKIRNYQLVVGGMLLMNFPLSYLLLKFGLSPACVYFVAIGVAISCMLLRLYFLRKMVAFPVRSFIREVIGKVVATFSISFFLPFTISFALPYGLSQGIAILVISVIISSLAILFIGCRYGERKFIIDRLMLIKRRVVC